MDKFKIRDKTTRKILDIALSQGVETVWERSSLQTPHCGFGMLRLCCTNCNLGPCRIDPIGNRPKYGVCGADEDIIAARNLLRRCASGSACHNDHGRELAITLLALSEEKTQGYTIKSEQKLKKIAMEYSVKVDGRDLKEIAGELASKILFEFGMQKGELVFIKRTPEKRRKIWRKLGIMPRGIDREVTEAISRTNMGVDNDYRSLIFSTMRVALSDGWGGSMVANELSDILFGLPQPVHSRVNLGVLKKDEVNIILHGHVPLLSDIVAEVALKKDLVEKAKKAGAKGINVVGMCCSANEILVRKGIPVAGNFLQQELAIVTGAVELMIVDIQCIMPSLSRIASCFHTKVISTHEKG